jgi:hypothetical protein
MGFFIYLKYTLRNEYDSLKIIEYLFASFFINISFSTFGDIILTA